MDIGYVIEVFYDFHQNRLAISAVEFTHLKVHTHTHTQTDRQPWSIQTYLVILKDQI